LLFATFAFAIQIYCDFSGYSDIALGSAQVMGIKLMKNFSHPYFAKSISEFWRRWHISLSTWFRDYVYIPLGGNRVKKMRWAFNLFITFLISGLWHGANWTYIIWGGLHGLLIVFFGITENFWKGFSRFIHLNRRPRLESGLSILSTFTLVSFAWIFFRASNLSDALMIIHGLFKGWDTYFKESMQIVFQGFTSFHSSGMFSLVDVFFGFFAPLTPEYRGTILVTLIMLGIFLVIETRQFKENFMAGITKMPLYTRLLLYATFVTLILAFGTAYVSQQQAFIYFQF